MSRLSSLVRKLRPPVPVKLAAWQEEIYARAARSTADLVEKHVAECLIFTSAPDIRDYAIAMALKSGLLIECGVFKGDSINRFADRLTTAGDTRLITGFDTFEGLKEDWFGTGLATGTAFNVGGRLPRVRRNVSLIKGLVQDTLPRFFAANSGDISLLHVDTDTYRTCVAVLASCRERLTSGSLILFDELIGFPNWQNGEYRALIESGLRFKYVAFGPDQALIRLS